MKQFRVTVLAPVVVYVYAGDARSAEILASGIHHTMTMVFPKPANSGEAHLDMVMEDPDKLFAKVEEVVEVPNR